MRIAMLGGTFDPIHNGHLELARGFARRLSLDQVILMPTAIPPHKVKTSMAPPDKRLHMCRLAVQDDPLFTVSDWEIARGGASFTVDTLQALTAAQPQAEWFLITGADMFLTLGSWWRFADIARMATLCAAPRDAQNAAQLRAYAAELEQQGARCVVADLPLMPVSSTALRKALAAGEDTSRWLPAPVADYIAREGLYTTKKAMNTIMTDEQFVDIIKGRLTERPMYFRLLSVGRTWGPGERSADCCHKINPEMLR